MGFEFERTRRQLLKKGELFEDQEFPCTVQSLYYHQSPPHQFTWKRPHELSHAPRFLGAAAVAGGGSDIIPGRLGDQWLVSSLAAVTLTRGLFYRVVPADQSFDPDEYAGKFCCLRTCGCVRAGNCPAFLASGAFCERDQPPDFGFYLRPKIHVVRKSWLT